MKTIDLYPGMSISDAASSESEGAVLLRLYPGTYREKVFIKRDDVFIKGMGEDPADTVIEWDDYALFIMPDGIKRGTFRSYTFFIKGKRNRLENISIKNTASPRHKCGQCIALFTEGDLFEAENCIFESFQDTLFTGPLPLKEIEPGGFRGPTENDERIIGRQYYKNCRISGDIDFIFGSARCFFEGCDIVSRFDSETLDAVKGTGEAVCGYCAAPSTYEGEEYGYVFGGCSFLNDGCPDGSVYLGRPWRDHAKMVLIDCYLDRHINEKGFHDWNKTYARKSFFFAESSSRGPGASDNRADFVKNIGKDSLDLYSKDKVLS